MFLLQQEKSTKTNNMDFSNEKFRELLDQSYKMIEDWYSNHLRDKKIYNNSSPKEIRKAFKIKNKNEKTNPSEVIQHLNENLIKHSNFNPSPNYYGYITGGGNQVGILGEFIKSALNQNNLKWHSAPANSEIENITIEWISKFIGYNHKESGGVLVSGGSVANLMNIAVMRKMKGNTNLSENGVYGNKIMRVYVSQEAHSSIDKAMDTLGLGTNNLIKIKTKNFKIDTKSLRIKINEDIEKGYEPIGVIGIAGTTNTGSVDPLKLLAQISKEFNLWFMVDAAYGGPAASIKKLKKVFEGIEEADSILVNPHKWMFVPFEVACVIVKNKENLRKTFSLIPEYLLGGIENKDRDDLMNYSIQLSKDFKALKVWMTIKTYGYKEIKNGIKNDISMAKYAYEIAQNDSCFLPIHFPELSIFCFKYKSKIKGVSDSLINKKIIDMIEEDGRVFFSGTKINNENVLRINCVNHRRNKKDVDFLFKVIKEIGIKAEGVLLKN